MVYQLARATEYEALRQGASAVPGLGAAAPVLYPAPYLVWGEGLPAVAALDGFTRELTLTVHNAGGAPCRIQAVKTGVAWLEPDWPDEPIAADGRPVAIRLRLRPKGLSAGDHHAQISVAAGWHQTLTHSLVLTVPDAPVAWFEEAAVTFAGEWPQRAVRVSATGAVRLLYEQHLIAEPRPEQVLRLYPGGYRFEGRQGTVATVQVPGLAPLEVTVPGNWELPGLTLQTTVRNVGTRILSGRLISSVPWLSVAPDVVQLLPGAAADVLLTCQDDGRHWDSREGLIHLRSQLGEQMLTVLPVGRDLRLPGPRPVLGLSVAALPPVVAGGTSTGSMPVRNAGHRPLEVRREGETAILPIHPGDEEKIPLSLGPAFTLAPGPSSGVVRFRTNAALPAWKYLNIPYALDVVTASLQSRAIQLGEVRYQSTSRAQLIDVLRSDRRRSRLSIDLPPELQEAVRITGGGDLITLRNMHKQPLVFDGEYDVRDLDLGGAVLGRLRLTGRCLVPRLAVEIPPLRLVPGTGAQIAIRLRDAGGGLDMGKVTADQSWVRLTQRGLELWANVSTGRWDRGTRCATLNFPSNDFVEPVQEHLLTVQLTPTFWMRTLDALLWPLRPLLPVYRFLLPVFRLLGRALRRLRPVFRMLRSVYQSLRAR